MSISVLILTKNEELNLPGCLASVNWCDDIHVYDSLSTDRTTFIAATAGALITSRKFDNWSDHQNWGLRNIKFKYPWVFYIDADERMSPELRDNIHALTSDPSSFKAFKVQRRDFLNGTWLKHSQASSFYIRLFRPEFISYRRLVNPVTVVDGDVGMAPGYLNHFPFNRGLNYWIERHNSYSSMEAQQIVNDRKDQATFKIISCFFEKDFHKRRFHQKELFYKLPMRPIVKFLILYIFRLGILDGKAGLQYSALQAIYEYFISLKLSEIDRLNRAA